MPASLYVILSDIYPVWIDDKNGSKEEDEEVGRSENNSNCRPCLQSMRGKYDKFMAAQHHLDKKTTENASLTCVVWKEEDKAVGYDGQGPKNS